MTIDWFNTMIANIRLIESLVEDQSKPFSGVIFIRNGDKVIFEKSYGMANRADSVTNKIDTRFGIASGCKIFTAVSICQLVEQGLLKFETNLKDCLSIDFPHFDAGITIHSLLTHTSGIPDYFDEEVDDDYEKLWQDRPVYVMREPGDFVPMFQNDEMKFPPGERFCYSDAGFILLGAIVEEATGLSFTEYVEKHVFAPCGMDRSGYFSSDSLPPDTARGYIQDDDGSWRTNVFAIPVVGGPDGGAFTTAHDLDKFWTALFENRLLSNDIAKRMLTPQIEAKSEGEGKHYGYGVWMNADRDSVESYFVEGWDPGVAMISEVFPEKRVRITIIGNSNYPAFQVHQSIKDAMGIQVRIPKNRNT